MKTPENLTVVIEKIHTGFSAYVKEIDGLVTVGDSLGEVKENMEEVISNHLDYLEELGENAAKITDLELIFAIDLEQLFEHYTAEKDFC